MGWRNHDFVHIESALHPFKTTIYSYTTNPDEEADTNGLQASQSHPFSPLPVRTRTQIQRTEGDEQQLGHLPQTPRPAEDEAGARSTEEQKPSKKSAAGPEDADPE